MNDDRRVLIVDIDEGDMEVEEEQGSQDDDDYV